MTSNRSFLAEVTRAAAVSSAQPKTCPVGALLLDVPPRRCFSNSDKLAVYFPLAPVPPVPGPLVVPFQEPSSFPSTTPSSRSSPSAPREQTVFCGGRAWRTGPGLHGASQCGASWDSPGRSRPTQSGPFTARSGLIQGSNCGQNRRLFSLFHLRAALTDVTPRRVVLEA